jgi:hypothetical protein
MFNKFVSNTVPFTRKSKKKKVVEADRTQMAIEYGACALRSTHLVSLPTTAMVTRTHLNITFIRTSPVQLHCYM